MKQKVYELLRTIPYGKVVTYGDIAAALGNKKLARVVGNILHQNEDVITYPCYKVVTAQGELSKAYGLGGIKEQEALLKKEGVEVIDGKVDLSKYHFVSLK